MTIFLQTFIDYIGQEDNTVLGSRDVPAFSLRQQVMEILSYSPTQDYIRNVRAFEEILKLGFTSCQIATLN